MILKVGREDAGERTAFSPLFYGVFNDTIHIIASRCDANTAFSPLFYGVFNDTLWSLKQIGSVFAFSPLFYGVFNDTRKPGAV